MRIIKPVRPSLDVDGPALFRKWMSDNNHNQSTLARLFKVTPSSVNRWCNEKSRPDDGQAIAIEDKTGVPRDAWLTAEEIEKRDRFKHLRPAA